jgi:hypothetical protein
MQLRSQPHFLQVQPSCQVVLRFSFDIQNSAKFIVHDIFLYVHNIKIVPKQIVFPIRQSEKDTFLLPYNIGTPCTLLLLLPFLLLTRDLIAKCNFVQLLEDLVFAWHNRRAIKFFSTVKCSHVQPSQMFSWQVSHVPHIAKFTSVL